MKEGGAPQPPIVLGPRRNVRLCRDMQAQVLENGQDPWR